MPAGHKHKRVILFSLATSVLTFFNIFVHNVRLQMILSVSLFSSHTITFEHLLISEKKGGEKKERVQSTFMDWGTCQSDPMLLSNNQEKERLR